MKALAAGDQCGWCHQPRPCKCKRRRRKAGHEKAIVALGTPSRSGTTEGWRASCKCGWTSGPIKTFEGAKKAYSEHKDQALPICSRCKEAKQPEEMAVRSPHMCKPCLTAKTQEWAAANPSEWEVFRRKSYLKRKYGLTIAQADALFESQGGKCAICGKPEGDSRGFRMHIDHDHATGRPRGVLCHQCNSGLGNFRDDPALLSSAIAYLAIHGQEKSA